MERLGTVGELMGKGSGKGSGRRKSQVPPRQEALNYNVSLGGSLPCLKCKSLAVEHWGRLKHCLDCDETWRVKG